MKSKEVFIATERLVRLSKVLNENGITVVDYSKPTYFTGRKKIGLPIKSNTLFEEKSFISLLHEIGHDIEVSGKIRIRGKEAFLKNDDKCYKRSFLYTMKDEIRAWKHALKLFEEIYLRKISNETFEYMIYCLFTYVTQRYRKGFTPYAVRSNISTEQKKEKLRKVMRRYL